MYRSSWKRKAETARMAASLRARESRGCARGVMVIGMAVLLLGLPTTVSAEQIAIAQYPIPTAISSPYGITAGPDGALWFTEDGSSPSTGKIGRITTAGAITEYTVPTVNSYQGGITAGPDGALWFTLGGGFPNSIGAIGRITTAGVVTEYPLPTLGSDPIAITRGPDGALWFTEFLGNKIGRITTGGVITEYPVPTANSDPDGITAGPDGALWFTEATGNNIGRITTAGSITEYPIPTAGSSPYGITAGPDGALWFTEENLTYGNQVGRITTEGVITQYPLPGDYASCITAGPDGALWFVTDPEYDLGRITTAGVITEYLLPSHTREVGGAAIAVGPDGALWFTEDVANNIGQAVFVTAGLSVSPATGVYQTSLTFAGSAFAPNENVTIYDYGIGSKVLASATADGNGSFMASARNPVSPYGLRPFFAVGQSSGKVGAANFSVHPRLVLSPNTGPVGSTVTAQGFGFGSFEEVKIHWDNPAILLGTVTANVNGALTGSAALTFTVPTGSPAGVHKVLGKGSATLAVGQATFTVQ